MNQNYIEQIATECSRPRREREIVENLIVCGCVCVVSVAICGERQIELSKMKTERDGQDERDGKGV